MQQATLTMSDGAHVDIYFSSEDPIDFEAIEKSVAITDVHVTDGVYISDMTRCRIGLHCGDFIFCYLPKDQVNTIARKSEAIVWCAKDDTLKHIKNVADEVALNRRLDNACALLCNHPDLELRERMTEAYVKRKAAYVATVESLVSGMTNEQSG